VGEARGRVEGERANRLDNRAAMAALRRDSVRGEGDANLANQRP